MIEAEILLFLILILITFGLYIWRRTAGSARQTLHLVGRVTALSLVIVPLALFVTYKLMNARTYQVFGRIVPRVDVSRPLIALTLAAEIRMSGRQPMQSRKPKQGLEKDRLRRGNQIIQRAQRAMGGAEKLSAVKTAGLLRIY